MAEPDLQEEAVRQAAYASEGPTGGTKLGGKYLPGADSLKFYEMYGPHDQRPSLLVFTKATTDRQAPTRIFRIGADVTYKIVEWVAIKAGDWPTIPKVDESEGPLLRRWVRPIAPVMNDPTAKEFKFKVEGRYIYVLDTPPKDTDTILAPRVPYYATDVDRRELSEDDQEDLTSTSAGE